MSDRSNIRKTGSSTSSVKLETVHCRCRDVVTGQLETSSFNRAGSKLIDPSRDSSTAKELSKGAD